jgi:hypothetical protein
LRCPAAATRPRVGTGERQPVVAADGNGQAAFRQYADRVEILQDPSALIEFDQVVGDDCAMAKDIVASVYDVQLSLFSAYQHEWIEPAKASDFEQAYRKLRLDNARELAEMYRAK